MSRPKLPDGDGATERVALRVLPERRAAWRRAARGKLSPWITRALDAAAHFRAGRKKS